MRKFMEIVDKNSAPPEYEDSDADHYDALAQTGFFGQQAAGSILMAKTTGRIMLVLRSAAVQESFSWGNCGGAHHADELPADAAKREVYEETGYNGSITMVPLNVFQKESFRYFNFLAIVDMEFKPELGWEADDFKWCDYGDFPSPLHFGMESLFSDPKATNVIEHYVNLFHSK